MSGILKYIDSGCCFGYSFLSSAVKDVLNDQQLAVVLGVFYP
jgi:hypothetical protein